MVTTCVSGAAQPFLRLDGTHATPILDKPRLGFFKRGRAPVRPDAVPAADEDRDRPEPSQPRERVAILVHAPDRAAVLKHGVIELFAVDGGREAGGTRGEGHASWGFLPSVDEQGNNDGGQNKHPCDGEIQLILLIESVWMFGNGAEGKIKERTAMKIVILAALLFISASSWAVAYRSGDCDNATAPQVPAQKCEKPAMCD
jgi:hypothetical protein